MNATSVRQELSEVVDVAMERYHVPGVAVGIAHGSDQLALGFGVTSVEHPLPVTEHTLFQIGSTTKTVTGTIAMRLVEDGKLEMDAPVRTYLPSLRLSSEDAAARVTMRHLLTHTSGIQGDYFDDPSRGDEALQRMVEIMETLPQLTPLGELYSYCNSGFYLAGRIIEVITGKPYETVARDMVLDPLGMSESFFFPEDVMTYSFAIGHYVHDGVARVARPWALPRTANPAGGITSSVIDNLKYARFHMGDGTTEDGTRLLQAESLTIMQTPDNPTTGGQWVGMAWMIRDVGGTRIVEHTGGTNGQVSLFSMVPEQRFAIAVQTNATEALLQQEVRDWAFERLLGLKVPEPMPLDATDDDLAQYAGRYEAAADVLEFSPDGGRIRVVLTPKGGFPLPDSPPEPAPPPFHVLLTEGEGLLGTGEVVKGPVGEFIRGPDGTITWLRFGGRLHARR